jgi:putative polyketide hydroxylase
VSRRDVVGAGPAGLVAGITLARYGVGVLVVEKREEISTLSRALVLSTRSMEILRSWSLEDEVRSGAADVEPCGWATPTLASAEGTEIRLGYPTAAEAAKLTLIESKKAGDGVLLLTYQPAPAAATDSSAATDS